MEKARNFKKISEDNLIKNMEDYKLTLRKQNQFSVLMKKRIEIPCDSSPINNEKINDVNDDINVDINDSYSKFLKLFNEGDYIIKSKLLSNHKMVLFDSNKEKITIYHPKIRNLVLKEFLNNNNIEEKYLSKLLNIMYAYSIKEDFFDQNYFNESFTDLLLSTYLLNTKLINMCLLIFGNFALTNFEIFQEKYAELLLNKLILQKWDISTYNLLLWNIRIFLTNSVSYPNEILMKNISKGIGLFLSGLKIPLQKNKNKKDLEDLKTNLLNIYLILTYISNENLLIAIFTKDLIDNFLLVFELFEMTIEQTEYAVQFLITFFKHKTTTTFITSKIIEICGTLILKYKSCTNNEITLCQLIINLCQVVLMISSDELRQYLFSTNIIQTLIQYYTKNYKLIENVLNFFIFLFYIGNRDSIIKSINYNILNFVINGIISDRKDPTLTEKFLLIFLSIFTFLEKKFLDQKTIKNSSLIPQLEKVQHRLEQLSISLNVNVANKARKCLSYISNISTKIN